MPAVAALLGVVVFDFDPVGTILGFTVRWQYAAVAAIVFAALLVAGVIAVVAERRRVARLAADPERPAALAEAVRAAEETVRSSAPPAPAEAIPVEPAAVPDLAAARDAAAALEVAAALDAAAPQAEPAPAIPVDPAYPGWTPGHTAPHIAAIGAVAVVAPPAVPEPAASAAASAAAIGAVSAVAAEPVPAAPGASASAVSVEPPPPGSAAADPADIDDRPWPVGLRLDDLIFIVAGGTAGAVLFGRLGWILLYLDWYRVHTDAILDTAVGGLTLAGGVVGGILAGLLMAVVLGAPLARWLGVAVVPLLAALAAGKLAMVLGGAGQGLPYDGPWATAFAGPGPWVSLAPLIPSYPAQIFEAGTSAAVLVGVLFLALVPGLRRHPAALFAIGIGAWALGRFTVASLWRDPVLVAGLNGDQVVTLGITLVAAVVLVAIAARARRAHPVAGAVEA
jgi:prolipoprotein diacylglyceryltransferase